MIFRTARDFFDQIKGKKIAFIGVGVSHNQLIRQFAQRGARVMVCDRRELDKIEEAAELAELGITFQTGERYLDGIDADMILRTPGMYYNNPKLLDYQRKGVVVTSEMELFFELCPCKLFAVTGSDGKTTTTTLISEMLKQEGKTVHLGGNIGRALLPIIENIQPQDYAVVELSSFQLISMRRSPDVAVVTNVAPNHLDVHRNMAEYVASKENIFSHQNAFGRLVLNLDNEITKAMADKARGAVTWFSYHSPQLFNPDPVNPTLHWGTYLGGDGVLCASDKNGITPILHKSAIRLPGEHNVENYLAAITAVWGEVSVDSIEKVARNFGGVEHRIEFVRELNGVKWYNDSIATSPTRTIAGLNSFHQKLILIAGGYDKKIPFLPLGPKLVEKVKVLILMGDTAQKIEDTVTTAEGYNPLELAIIRADNMEQAVMAAKEAAKPGDIVTLSPACASFGQYKNFEERGRHYKQLVNALS